jgi:mRNA interferase MazF
MTVGRSEGRVNGRRRFLLLFCSSAITGSVGLYTSDVLTQLTNLRDTSQTKPPRVAPRIKAAPKVRQVYWCDFPRDAQLPEMWKTRPVVVLSYRNRLDGHCTVAACSTDPQEGSSAQWGHTLSLSFDGRQTYVVCNHIYTVASSRLSPDGTGIPRLPEAEFSEILKKLFDWLPRLPAQQEALTKG